MFHLLVTIAAALIALGIPAATFTEDATPAALKLASQRMVQVEDGGPIALSPDGRWLAAWRNSGDALEACAFETATLNDPRCVQFPGSSVTLDTATWSPDSTRLAFTEDTLLDLNDADLWVLDIEAGTLINLTDDGYTGPSFIAPLGTPSDVAPAWSPDGTELVFARSVEETEDVEKTALYRIPAVGGNPVELVTVAEDWLAVFAGVSWLADGTILYSVALQSDDLANGLWAVTVDGGDPQQLMSAMEAGFGAVVLVDVSVHGQALLLTHRPVTQFILVDLATGRTEPLKRSADAEERVSAAAFSPDGTRILFVSATAPSVGQLVVRELATGAEQELGELERPVGSEDFRSGIDWATNELVFGPSAAQTGVLLRLEAG